MGSILAFNYSVNNEPGDKSMKNHNDLTFIGKMTVSKFRLIFQFFIPVSLFLMAELASAQVYNGYNIRSTPGMNGRAIALTNESCELTGQHRGNSREVQCQGSNGVFTGWINRMGVEPSYRNRQVSTIQAAATPMRGVGDILFSRRPETASRVPRSPVATAPSGDTVASFTRAILQVTPERVQERNRLTSVSRRTRENVDLIQMPEVQVQGDELGSPLCGAYRARNRSPLFFTPQAGCMMAAVAQSWRQNHCPNNDDHCRLVVGDASHGDGVPSDWPHSTHRDGRCIDIYLPRRPGGGLSDSAGSRGAASRELTTALVQTLVDHGAAPNSDAAPGSGVIHNSNIPHTISWAGHGNHIHVCFPEHSSNQRICEQTRFDTGLCPELTIPQRHDGERGEPWNQPLVEI